MHANLKVFLRFLLYFTSETWNNNRFYLWIQKKSCNLASKIIIMRKGQRKLSGFRKRLSQYLGSLGYDCFHRDRMKVNDKWFCYKQNPEIDVDFLTRDLTQINKGEAFFYGEGLTADIACLPPNFKDPFSMPIEEATNLFHGYLKSGMEYEYPNPYREMNDNGEIDWVKNSMKLIDYQNVGANTFRAVECWQGREDADFLWDYVICVNTLPLVAIAIEPDEEGDAACQRAYEAMRHELDEDYVLRTYLQFCVISNGETTLVGSPIDTLDDFKPWPSLMGEEPPVGFQVPAETAVVSLLRPDRLLDVLQNNVRVEYRSNAQFRHFFGDYHLYFSLLKVQEAVMEHFSKSEEPFFGYVDLLKSEAELSSLVGSQAESCIMLAYFRLMPVLMQVDVCDRYLACYTCGLNAKILSELREVDKPLFLVFGSALTMADYHRLKTEFPDASIVQFRQLPLDKEENEEIGDCIYKATFPIR